MKRIQVIPKKWWSRKAWKAARETERFMAWQRENQLKQAQLLRDQLIAELSETEKFLKET